MDKYDKAIAYLTDHPDEIEKAWFDKDWNGEVHPHHCLFNRTHPDCGCLTQIRAGFSWGPNKKLTAEIESDERIPKGVEKITVADLPVFAEWQRRLDKELNRE